MKISRLVKPVGIVLGIAFLIFATSLSLFAFTGPSQNPPACPAGEPGCDAPLHVGIAAQVKDGPLGVEGAVRAYSYLVVDGSVGIGTKEETPQTKLDVRGGGRFDGELDMSGYRITGGGLPVDGTDYVTKDYVDSLKDGISVVDSRDGETYTALYVAGNYWFTQNLRYLPKDGGFNNTQFEDSTTQPMYYINGYRGTPYAADILNPSYVCDDCYWFRDLFTTADCINNPHESSDYPYPGSWCYYYPGQDYGVGCDWGVCYRFEDGMDVFYDCYYCEDWVKEEEIDYCNHCQLVFNGYDLVVDDAKAYKNVSYNYEAALTACPLGSHLPTDEEWHLLESYYTEGSCEAGRQGLACPEAGRALKLKSFGGSNISRLGFSPGGVFKKRDYPATTSAWSHLLSEFPSTNALYATYTLDSIHYWFDENGFFYYGNDSNKRSDFWTATESGSKAWTRGFQQGATGVSRAAIDKNMALPVRCVLD